MKVCTFDGCDRPIKARGLCGGHYQQVRDGRTLVPLRHVEYSTCTFDGCDREHQTNGLCRAHADQIRAGRPLKPIRRRAVGGLCEFDGCGRKHYSKGFCVGHYKQSLLNPPRFKPLDGTLADYMRRQVATRDRSTCWTDWPGSRDKAGRPQLGTHVGVTYASRFGYFLVHGEWPFFGCHRCPDHPFGEDPSCFNPDHIYDGDRGSNAADFYRYADARRAAQQAEAG